MSDMGVANNAVYQSMRTVESYAHSEDLQPAEQSILGELKDRLIPMKMLDIGVGAGRTTVHFAPLVKEYTGIDYSQNMVKACQKRFGQMSFQTADARSMGCFKDSTFDFILFSFNGIDCMSHEDREKVLQEIKRVGRSGGLFCFSTHNLGYIKNFFKVPLNRKIFHALRRYFQTKEILKARAAHAVIRDGGENYQLQTYYIKPSEQLEVLHQNGFNDIRVFLEKTGKEVTDLSQIDHFTNERWLYYLCRVLK
jgi:ubiquinone/menaquinone biosynthesis C-methylase UbiE